MMRNWSAEELFIRAYAAGAVAAQGVWDLVKGVERITKPPRRTGGFDEDAAGDYPYDTPNPTEPGLDDSELIGVRGLLQERYGDQSERDELEAVHDEGYDRGRQDAERIASGMSPNVFNPYRDKSSAPVKSTPGTGAGSHAPADYGTAGSSPSDACDIPPSPSEGRLASPSPQDAGTLAGDRPGSERVPDPGHPDDAAAEWIGGAVPVIDAVLADHHYWSNGLHCKCGAGIGDGIDPFDWRQHVAPLIANALAPQPKPAFPETGLEQSISSSSRAAYSELTRADGP